MKHKLLSSVLLSGLILSITAFAEATKYELAIEYLELSQTRQSIESSIDTYAHQIADSQEGVEVEGVRAIFNKMMGWEVIKKPISDLVVKHLTVGEIKAANEFYKTKEGESIADKSEIISSEMSALLIQRIQGAVQSSQK